MRIDDDAKRAERESSGLLPILLGTVLGLASLVYLAPEQRIAFEQTGLGIGTTESYVDPDKGNYHCSTLENGARCIHAVNDHSDMRQVLWLGASQLHAINDKQPGDRTGVVLVHEQLLSHDTFVTAFSMPNANFQEFDVLFEHLRQVQRVDILVVGAVYDDMREAGVRAAIADPVKDAKAPAPLVPTKVEQHGVNENLNTQQRVEAYLNERLSGAANVWAARADFRGQLVVGMDAVRRWLLIVRNAVLGIDSTKWSVRIDKAQYAANKAALDNLMESARRANIAVLLYVAPRPIDAYFPYNLSEYQAFKSDMANLAQHHGAQFVNLEDAVVGDVWGLIDNGVGEIVTDIFHFQAAGHRQLADGLMKALAPLLSGDAKQ